MSIQYRLTLVQEHNEQGTLRELELSSSLIDYAKLREWPNLVAKFVNQRPQPQQGDLYCCAVCGEGTTNEHHPVCSTCLSHHDGC